MWTLRVTLCCLLQSGFVTEQTDMTKSVLPIILKAWGLGIDWLATHCTEALSKGVKEHFSFLLFYHCKDFKALLFCIIHHLTMVSS